MSPAARSNWYRSLDDAIDRAHGFLFAQAEEEFAETRHDMTFPRAAGFSSLRERQSSDVFARAVLGSVLAEIADLDPERSERSIALRRIARREADYVASKKMRRCEGGWSYFPDLPELPPDADSLAAALSLFSRAAPEHVELCRRPIDLVLAGARPDGAFETWIIAPADPSAVRERMEWGVRCCWGTDVDLEVVAHFYN